jgi:hypothetical protein
MERTSHRGLVKLFSLWWAIGFLTLEVCNGQGGKAYQAKVTEEAATEANAIPGCRVLWKQEQAIQKYVQQHPEVLSATGTAKRTAWNFQVGDRKAWWATNLVTNTEYQVPSTCRAVGTHAYYFVEDSLWNTGRVMQAQVDSVGAAFDLRTPASPTKGIYETDVETFGNPPDVDNDPKIIILILDIKDGFTGTGSYVAGYFYSLNEFPEGTFSGHHSNDAEIYYVDANPTNLATSSGLGIAIETTAHEFQHMIHWNYDRNEITFMNEGCSMVAEVVCGFPVSFQSSYTSNTNVYLLQWNSSNDIPDYARAQRWVLYLWNQFPNGYLKLLVQNTGTGVTGINNALAQYSPTTSRRFDDIFRDWLVANSLNDASVDSKYGYSYSGVLSEPVGSKYFDPNTGVQSGHVVNLAAEYITFAAGSNLSIMFNTSSPDIVIKAIEIGPSSKRVVDVPFGIAFSEAGFGITYTSITFAVINPSQTTEADYSYQASGSGPQSVELKYDDGEPEGYLGLSPGDSIMVSFDGAPGTRLDSLRIAFRRSGTIRMGVWKYNGSETTEPLGQNLLPPVNVVSRDSAASVPYPIPYNNWVTVDLRQYPIDAGSDFAVCFVVGSNPTAPAVMISSEFDDGNHHSFTWSQSNGNRWVVFTDANNSANAFKYLVRAYVHSSTSAPEARISTFSAEAKTRTVFLAWSTSDEINVIGYAVQRRSVGDSVYQTLAVLESQNTSGVPGSYSYVYEDSTVKSGTYLYRVEQMNMDNSVRFSEEITVSFVYRPGEFALFQNHPNPFPNPFNPNTIIEYDLPSDGHVLVAIYTILGQEVERLVDTEQRAGHYSLVLSGSRFASGVYFCRLEAPGFTQTRKMLLLK